MHYCTGNMMKYIGRAKAICITTNGFVKSDGTCVMGAGVAKQFSDMYPQLPKILGDSIKANGNHVSVITNIAGTDIIAFPTKLASITITDMNQVVSHKRKDFKIGQTIPGFWALSDKELIRQSCSELTALCRKENYKYLILPIPGCSNGGLNFKTDVEPILLEKFSHLDEVYIMSFKEKDFL